MARQGAYAILNLRKGATDEQIKESYIRLVKRFDPERHTDRFMVIQNAYDRLTDPVKRAREDVLAFTPVQGRFQFLDEEKAEADEAALEKTIAQMEGELEKGDGAEEKYEALAKALMLLSAQSIRRRQYQRAIDAWERILQIDPTHQRAKNNLIFARCSLAYSYAEHELYEEAIEMWVRASQMNPDDDATVHNLALACEAAGRKDEAERYWAEALRRWKLTLDRTPDDEYLRNCILEVHRHHGGRAMEAAPAAAAAGQGAAASASAVKEYKEILKIAPDDYEAQYQIAVSQMEQRQWSEAVESLKTLIRKNPKSVEAMNLLGWALLNSGQIDAAFMAWRQSIQIDPKNLETRDAIIRAHLDLGKRCREQGQYSSALKHFKSLVKIVGPKNPEVHLEIGSTYYLKGDKRAAFLEFQAVLQLDPRNQAARKMMQELRMR
ncbi:MAG: tetratricopeptide repeat protein [Candidatus Sumerlaeota bacterium]|nr:tetratricopeptide repeat protein [Candidatus Sumerlaeota bacterium]